MCIGCTPAPLVDMRLKIAIDAAGKQSKEKGEPVAVYKKDGEYLFKNAYDAYNEGLTVVEVVSENNGNKPALVYGM